MEEGFGKQTRHYLHSPIWIPFCGYARAVIFNFFHVTAQGAKIVRHSRGTHYIGCGGLISPVTIPKQLLHTYRPFVVHWLKIAVLRVALLRTERSALVIPGSSAKHQEHYCTYIYILILLGFSKY